MFLGKPCRPLLAQSTFAAPTAPGAHEWGAQHNIRCPTRKSPDALLPKSISFLPQNPLHSSDHAGLGQHVFLSSTRAPILAELFSLETRTLSGHVVVVETFDLRQRLRGHGFVGDIVPYR